MIRPASECYSAVRIARLVDLFAGPTDAITERLRVGQWNPFHMSADFAAVLRAELKRRKALAE